MNQFNNTSLLITHYNRSASLERLLKNFQALDIQFGEIVVSDDGSKTEHLNHLENLQALHNFTLVKTVQNKGLGNNINKGQDAVTLPYTLYVQEDFSPKNGLKEALTNAHQFMQEDDHLDIVRLYAYGAYPHLTPFAKGFSLMHFNLRLKGYGKFYYYSDHPHLRRSSFLEKFGRYAENENPEQTEYRMMMSFLQKKGKGLFYNNYKELFDHGNTEDEPSTMERGWRRSKNPAIATARFFYRHIKFNTDYLFRNYHY
ncbi:glycosyltransferase [Marivirga sp. S37H4]|uniref:Glycosyltransferase n=1 Tax=Marivirga aurantiaca TaxID=2802615 RepID=A0A934X142_9BACT|nr:glycosyltransferase [Marivirga aurantiaca]MBK6266527.1 glycosyltransferase [Marivirga aurantiaca]